MSIYETQLNILSKTAKLINETLKNTEKELSIKYSNDLELLRKSLTDESSEQSEYPEITLDRLNCLQKSRRELEEINKKYDRVFFDLINQVRRLEVKIHQYHRLTTDIFDRKKELILDK